MTRYALSHNLLREREYYDTEAHADLFSYARAQIGAEGFNPENAVVAVTVGSPDLYSFNLTAGLVLEGIAQGMDSSQIAEVMADLFDEDPDTIGGDVDEVIGLMEKRGIVVKTDD